MRSNNPNIRKFLLALLLITSVGFIGVSSWLVGSLITKRQHLTILSDQAVIVAELESDLTTSLEAFMAADFHEEKHSLDKVFEQPIDTTRYPELRAISEKIDILSEIVESNNELSHQVDVERGIADLRSFIIGEKRRLIDLIKDAQARIDMYWNSTFILIGFACLIALTLTIVAFVFYYSRKKISDLKTRNSVFMKSIVDCVVLCDNTGKIVDYNEAVQKTFNYGPRELIGKQVTILYGNDTDWKRVSDALKTSQTFKGEIVNQRKDNAKFLSFLSANTVFNEKGEVIGTMGISRDITNQKQNEFQLQHIINNATDIIFSTDEQGIITYINPTSKEMIGYDHEALIGKSYKILVHEDYQETLANHFGEQFKTKVHDTYIEYKMLKADGETLWVGQNSRLIFDPTNAKIIKGFFGVVRNIDEISKLMLELKASETKFRELFDNSLEMIQSMTATGEILYVNESWKHRFGYSDGEVESLNVFDLIHEESRVYCENILGEILKIGGVNDEKEIMFKMITKTGDVVVVKGSLGVKYEKNQVVSIQAFLRDVTEQAAIEEALKKSEENFRIIGNSINDVFFLYDYELAKYDYISPNCEAMLGAKPEFFLSGKKYFEHFVHPDDRAKVKDIELKVKNGEVGSIEYRRIVGDDIRWVNEKWFPIRNEFGDTVRISGVCRDITEMKQAYNTIYEQNIEISQSILYAKNIQESTLPTAQEVHNLFSESFVFYRAKDVLSGDLYIFESVLGSDDKPWPAFIVGDCTGHGVPGGVLSLLCSGLLTESLTSPKVNNPAEALDFVRSKLIRLFRSNPSKYILDGMDAAFCVFNPDAMELHFAGAYLTCYLVRGNEVLEYKGDKQPVGYSSDMEPFVNYTIEMEKGDIIYLTTDGYVDQFGGPMNKKFLRKRFTKLLLEIKDLPMSEQGRRIEKSFFDWKGKLDQTDDIALVGVKI